MNDLGNTARAGCSVEPFRIVAQSSPGVVVMAQPDSSAPLAGIAQASSTVQPGQVVDLQPHGEALVCTGAAVGLSDLIVSGRDGCAVPMPAGYVGQIVGRSLDAASDAGELLRVRVQLAIAERPAAGMAEGA